MAKIISEMYPVQDETVPSVSTSKSEVSETVPSDVGKQESGFSANGSSRFLANFNKLCR